MVNLEHNYRFPRMTEYMMVVIITIYLFSALCVAVLID